MTNRALLLVDLQNDFCAGGALAVAEGDSTIDIANALIDWC
ncbi:nicotinamidase/pyrazinamidase [Salmonella enterica subsp. houtenae serovar 50:g,z51:- str. 01-0133]|nr:isochorismatase family protein [Salmonella enterica]ESE90310.1 nicotinamidase/pyrazinamidase [Salmonella enterica subsp. houtenae serovar 50:g,z51:- str. 01-0133]